MLLYRVIDILIYRKTVCTIKIRITAEGHISTHQCRCPGTVSQCPPGVMIVERFGSSKLSLLSDHLPALRVVINLSVCFHLYWPLSFDSCSMAKTDLLGFIYFSQSVIKSYLKCMKELRSAKQLSVYYGILIVIDLVSLPPSLWWMPLNMNHVMSMWIFVITMITNSIFQFVSG